MNSASVKLKRTLFVVIMALLLLPLLQSTLSLVKVKPLNGAFTLPADSSFTVDRWLRGNFQKQKDTYLNSTFGFREFFVRINNQFYFSLFHIPHAVDVIIGKQDYLYVGGNIISSNGCDFLGDSAISRRMRKLHFVTDTLAKLNKTVIMVIGPGKASFYPEFIPDSMHKKCGPTNYQFYSEFANRYNLNFINLHTYFLAHKHLSRYPLYPRYGVHWSSYGDCIVADSLIHYIEHARNIRMPHIYWNKVDITGPQKRDNDAELSLNLFHFASTDDILAYPEVEFESDSGKIKPAILVIADSYFGGIYDLGFFKCFSHGDFWFYNRTLYTDNVWGTELGDIDLKQELAKRDVIMLLATDANLHDYGWGFIDKAYDLYGGPKLAVSKEEHDERFHQIVESVWKDTANMHRITKQAEDMKISLDSAVILNAIYIQEHENP